MENNNKLPLGMQIIDPEKHAMAREDAKVCAEPVTTCEDNSNFTAYCYPQPALIQVPGPTIMDTYTMADMAAAGVSLKQAQSFNSQRQSNMLALEKKVLEHQADLAFKEQTYLLEQKYNGVKCASIPMGIDNFGTTPLNVSNIIESFRVKYQIVKERVNGSLDWRYLIRDVDSLRHTPCDEKDLYELFLDFLEETSSNYELNQAEVKRLFEKLKRRHVPKLSNADNLEMIPDTSLVFKNGVLDIISNNFTPSLPVSRFNRFAMDDFDYPQANKAPEAFNAFLDDVFQDNENWKKLCYQIIGALLLPAATLKRIYVFQGVSNAGKTRLSNIIMRMMDEADVTEFNTLSDITTSDKDTQLHHTRLVNIKEASNKKISAKQISYLKGYADGGSSAAKFKILVGTNYKLTTGDDGELESALRNRFIVLPFPNAMTNEDPRVASFEDCYFEKEKPYIARKALEAFSEVLRNDGMFCCEPEINKYIADVDDGITGGDSASKQDAMATVEQYYTVGDTLNLQLSGQEILERLKEADPANFREMSPASLSRMLNYGLKGKLMSKRIKNVTRYNLFFKEK